MAECHTMVMLPFIRSWCEGLTVALSCWLNPLRLQASLIALCSSEKPMICGTWQAGSSQLTLICSHRILASDSRRRSYWGALNQSSHQLFQNCVCFYLAWLKWSPCLRLPSSLTIGVCPWRILVLTSRKEWEDGFIRGPEFECQTSQKTLDGTWCACNPSAGETETGGSLGLSDQPSLICEPQTVRDPVLINSNKIKVWETVPEDLYLRVSFGSYVHRHAHTKNRK